MRETVYFLWTCANIENTERPLHHPLSAVCYFSNLLGSAFTLCPSYNSFIRGCLRSVLDKKFWIFSLSFKYWKLGTLFQSENQVLLSYPIKTVTYSAELVQVVHILNVLLQLVSGTCRSHDSLTNSKSGAEWSRCRDANVSTQNED